MGKRSVAFLVSIAFGVQCNLVAAPKISITSVKDLDSYTKVYVVPIRNDTRKVQPKVVERMKKAGFDTVDLRTEQLPFSSQGTGFILSSEGDILTCAHVVGREPSATLWIGTNRYIGQVTAIDTNLDVALIRVEGSHPPFQALKLVPGAEQRMGQEVFTMGFPAADVLGSKPRLNKGMISSTVGAHDDERYVQISTPVQPGNSGSPLLDDKGRIVGMVNATINPLRFLLVEGNVPQNVNFAIKSGHLRAFLAASTNLLPEATTNLVASAADPVGDVFEGVAKSLVLVRGGIVDEQRLRERPLLCRCSYTEVVKGEFFRLRMDFVDVRKLAVVVTANLDQSSSSSEDKVLDAMCEQICDRLFPDKVNPFNPKKPRNVIK